MSKSQDSQLLNKPDQFPAKDLANVLTAEMKRITDTRDCTKRTAARLAIKNAIRSEVLKPGDLLPSEKELTIILGVSLGTVQAALGQLKSLGAISRRRGDGSRVTDQEPFAETVWHFRFISKDDGTPLIIRDEKLRVEETETTGPWSEYFSGAQKFVRIWRYLVLRDGIRAGADMFLDYSDASALMNIDHNELLMANIRPFLDENFGLSTKGASHRIRTTSINQNIADEFDLPLGEECFEIHARAYSPSRQPVYFQRIFVPTAQCAIEL